MLEIIPTGQIDQSIRLPGSKYIANRLIPMCALASTSSNLTNIVDNNDIQAAIAGLTALGYPLELHGDELDISPRLEGLKDSVTINTSHSGTFSRFVSAIAALEGVDITINCSEKMATRPMQELFTALHELGVTVNSPNQMLPATIRGPVSQSQCNVDAARSSQFLSALLIAGSALENGIRINLLGKGVSNSYVDMTIFWLKQLGITVQQDSSGFQIEKGQKAKGIDVEVPGDAVSASYFMGLVGIAGGQVQIDSFDHHSLQGESKFYTVLEKMGMTFEKSESSIIAKSTGQLKGIDVDMGEMPDVVQTLAVMACFAKGKTRIRNIAHLAFKESDRIKDTATELAKTGINVTYGIDFLEIEGGVPLAATIETYDDHRMAMSMALLGANTKGIEIRDPNVVNKSFPTYWSQMALCGLKSKSIE